MQFSLSVSDKIVYRDSSQGEKLINYQINQSLYIGVYTSIKYVRKWKERFK